jgi:hypothetical protein
LLSPHILEASIIEKAGVFIMLESVWRNEHLDIQADTEDKQMVFTISGEESAHPIQLQFNQAELFELIHAFLAINRTFQNEKPYYK